MNRLSARNWSFSPDRNGSVTPTCRGTRTRHAAERMGYQAKEPQWAGSRVLKLVYGVGVDVNRCTRAKGMFDIAFPHNARTREDVDLVFMGVGVFGSMPPGRDFELAHAEAGRPVRLADKRSDLAPGGPVHFDGGGLYLFAVDHFHGWKPHIVARLAVVPVCVCRRPLR